MGSGWTFLEKPLGGNEQFSSPCIAFTYTTDGVGLCFGRSGFLEYEHSVRAFLFHSRRFIESRGKSWIVARPKA